MRVEGAPPSTPFVLEATLHTRRLQNGISIALGELHDGGTVKSRDRIQLAIRTSESAYLYLAFCSQLAMDPLRQRLTVYSPQKSIRVKANETSIIPDKTAEIVLDDNPGQEVLYLIVSHDELSRADSRLAEAITAARQEGKAADCGEHFRAALAGADKLKPTPRPPSSGRASSTSSGRQSGSSRSNPLPPVPDPDPFEPIVSIERGGDIIWNGGVNGDATGIAILRYGFTHVATASPP